MDFTIAAKLPDLTLLTDEVVTQVDQVMRKTALDIFTGINAMSPVRQIAGGLFRGSWLLSNGAPGSRVATTPDPSGASAMAAGVAALAGRTAQQKQTFASIFIVNNLPYAQRLEEGYSRQAEFGVVGPTIARFR